MGKRENLPFPFSDKRNKTRPRCFIVSSSPFFPLSLPFCGLSQSLHISLFFYLKLNDFYYFVVMSK